MIFFFTNFLKQKVHPKRKNNGTHTMAHMSLLMDILS